MSATLRRAIRPLADALISQIAAGEVETAKASVEVPSPFAGRVATLHAAVGDDVAVGASLVTFEVVDERLERVWLARTFVRSPVCSTLDRKSVV